MGPTVLAPPTGTLVAAMLFQFVFATVAVAAIWWFVRSVLAVRETQRESLLVQRQILERLEALEADLSRRRERSGT